MVPSSAKYQLVAWLTLIPTSFTFIAIILINIGGVSPTASYGWFAFIPEMNTAFNLVNSNLTVSHESSIFTYSYNLYLNRLCGLSQLGKTITSTCRNNRIHSWIHSGPWFWNRSSWTNASHFQFSSIDLDTPFAFYLLAAFWCVIMMVPGIAGARQYRYRIMALANSAITFLFILIASACITEQLQTLKRQLKNNNSTEIYIPIDGNIVPVIVDVLSIESISVGNVVMDLTWVATFAMLVETIMWAVAMRKLGRPENEIEDLEMNRKMMIEPRNINIRPLSLDAA